MISRATLVQFFVAALTLSPFAAAQSTPFQITVQDQNQNVTAISNGATLTLNASAVTQSVGITLTITYRGSTVALLAAPQLTGSPAFSLTTTDVAQTLSPGGSFSIGILFTPSAAVTTSGPPATAQLVIPYKEAGVGTSAGTSGTLAFGLSGTTPNFILAYDFASNQNVMPLSDGGTLAFPATPVGSTSSAVVDVENIGNGPGTISSIQVTGAAFAPQGLALLPGAVNSGSALQFTIIYTPQKAGGDTGTLIVTFPDRTVTINLTGSGTAPAFTYQLIQNGQASAITPGQAIALNPVAVGTAIPFSITVQNTGNANGTINGISIAGSTFQLVNPPAFPQIIAPGGLLTLNFTFTPTQPGPVTGLITIGGVPFTVTGTGLGSQLTFSYTIGSVTIPVTGSLATFSSVQVGQSSSATFTIQNTGTSSATIVSIFISNPGVFTLAGLPALPLILAPGASVSFSIIFTPTSTAVANATLQINGQTINLTGSGTPPPALPAYQFTGASGTEQALQQPSIGLTLLSTYPLPITGTLTMVEISDNFSADPSVQFSTGGQTVAFSIPANTTQAIFQNGATSIRLQTGSVSGTITITPSFTTSGGFSLTPAGPVTLQFTVPAAPPQLLNVQLSQSSATSFTLQVIGLATSRTLSQLNFVFTPEPGYNLAGSTVSVNVAALSAVWFQSAAAQSFGSQFIISVPFSLAANAKSVTNSLAAIQSVTVSATNGLGTSNSVSTPLQ